MDWTKIVFQALGVGIPMIVMLAISKGNSKIIEKNRFGKTELSMGPFFKYFAIFFLILGFCGLIIPFYFEEADAWYAAVIIILVFGGFGLYTWMAFKNYKVILDENYLTVINWKGIQKKTKWTDIKSVKYRRNMSDIKITTYGNDVLKVYQFIVGLRSFVLALEKYTDWSNDELKIPF